MWATSPFCFYCYFTIFVHGKRNRMPNCSLKLYVNHLIFFLLKKKKRKKKPFDVLTAHTVETGKGTINHLKESQFLWIYSNEYKSVEHLFIIYPFFFFFLSTNFLFFSLFYLNIISLFIHYFFFKHSLFFNIFLFILKNYIFENLLMRKDFKIVGGLFFFQWISWSTWDNNIMSC